MFKKNRASAKESVVDESAEAPNVVEEETETETVTDTWEGPYDSGSVPDVEINRIDVGALQIAGFTDLKIHFEPDPQNTRFVSILLTYQDSALRLQPLAAPRSGGLWEEMREQITEAISQAQGSVSEVEGTFGPELRGQVLAVTPEGQQVRQEVRLVGIEGPRWLLHGVFMGAAAVDDRKAEPFEDVIRQSVVDRGNQPMAPGDVLKLSLPPDAQPANPPAEGSQADTTPPGPPEPGVHITETR